MKFTPDEIAHMERDPDALRAAANFHHAQGAMAGAIGEPETQKCASAHHARARELDAEAARLQAEYES